MATSQRASISSITHAKRPTEIKIEVRKGFTPPKRLIPSDSAHPRPDPAELS
jgi:hypothetical protein